MNGKRLKASKGHYSTVHWYNTDYRLLNGFLLPGVAYSAIAELVRLGRFKSLDAAILDGIRTVLEENAALLVRGNRDWMSHLTRGWKQFENVEDAKADSCGKRY